MIKSVISSALFATVFLPPLATGTGLPSPAAPAIAPAAGAGPQIINGDFGDLAGMIETKDGWHSGLPKGWRGSESSYAVHAKKGATPPTCNPSAMGFLRQSAGALDRASDVVLAFDVSEPWKPGAALQAQILDGNLSPLAIGDFAPGTRHQLAAKSVPAGTSIIVAFRATSGTPGLDNVTLETRPTSSASTSPPPADEGSPITVACYYFGNYHPGDPRNEKSKGKGWSEWELVKAAKPRFPGHQQPKVPLWGYTDESDPDAMAQKIDAAADHGIDAFIFDWYYYNDGPFLDRPIDIGFLKAKNNARIKFAFMWANHDWIEIHPYRRGAERKVLYPGVVTPENFERICDHVIKSYFPHPSYWRIDGRPYFSFYELTKLMDGFGSVEATRKALDKFRAKTVAAGLPGLHLNAVVWGRPILPGEKQPADPAQLVKDLGFDSVTSYVWIHHVALPKIQTDYDEARDAYFDYWNRAEKMFGVPYFPNVTMGWDSSPRAHQEDEFGNFGYPFTNTIGGNTPERFRAALEMTRRRLLARTTGPRIFNINCWNEWTEGSYLEPDTIHGMKYLEAVRDVFRPPVKFVPHRLGDYRSEAIGIGDFNGDKKTDVVAGPNLYLAPDWKPIKVRTLTGPGVDETGKGYMDDFANLPLDVDRDGRLDIVSVGWFSKSVRWHRNALGTDGDWPESIPDNSGNFESAELLDIDGDGKALEILANGKPTIWFETGKDPSGQPTLLKRVISERPMAFGGGAGDINGDGRPDVLRPEAWFEAPEDPRSGQWIEHPWALGAPGGKADHTPQILVLDVNGDKLADIVTSSAHKHGIFWYEQVREGGAISWKHHLIDDSWSQAHSLALADIDADGTPDLVTGKRFMAHNGKDPDEFGKLGVYWYRLKRGPQPEWTRYPITFDKGIGSGVNLCAADIDGDGDVDVIVTGKWGGPVLFENKLK